ncbi:hypothetical protein CFOL_v3_20510, partial [Cephalotus follicularis]
HEYPLSIMNHLGFRKFVSSLQPQLSTGGRVFSLHCNRLHKNTSEALMCSQNWLSSEEGKSQQTIL